MTSLVCYSDNGEIIKVVKGNKSTIAANAELVTDAYLITETPVSRKNHYVNIQSVEIAEKGAQPSAGHIFNYVTGVWELDLTLAKSAKWSAIKAARDAQEFSQFDWGGYTFQCDEVSQRRIQGAVQLASIDDTLTLDWTLADNSVQSFTASEYVQIGQALANHVSQCHARGRILRNQIESATTETELEAIVW